MTTRKSNSRAARKLRARAAGMDPTITQAFRQVEEMVTWEYLEVKKFLRAAQERLVAQIQNTFWRDAKFMKKCREEVNLSQGGLAEATGISRLIIANYETGVTIPTVDSALHIYKVLDTLGSVNALQAKVEIDTLSCVVGTENHEIQRGRFESMVENMKRATANLVEMGTELQKDKDRLIARMVDEAKAKAAKQP